MAIVAQFIKSAAKIAGNNRISGRTGLVKMICFAELERGLEKIFDFRPNHYGLYDEEVIKVAKELEREGLIKTEAKQEPYPQTVFKATEKLLSTDTGLPEREIKIIENTIREYWRKANADLSVYCKQMYVNKDKRRTDREIRELRLKEDNKPLKELIAATDPPEWWKNAPSK